MVRRSLLFRRNRPLSKKSIQCKAFFGKQAQRRACWNRVANSSNFAAVRKIGSSKEGAPISPENENLRAHE